jgi:hypothetical protein
MQFYSNAFSLFAFQYYTKKLVVRKVSILIHLINFLYG